jgi:hypothetical protein
MRWTWSLRKTIAGVRGRRSRVVLTPRWLVSSSREAHASLGATVTNKLWSRRGEHGISRKPSRREGRIASAEPVCSCAPFSLLMHARPRVQRAPGLPCALFIQRGPTNLQKLGRNAPREREATRLRRARHRVARMPPSGRSGPAFPAVSGDTSHSIFGMVPTPRTR